MLKHFECFRFAGFGGSEGRHQIFALYVRDFDARIGERERTRRNRRRLLGPISRRQVSAAFDLAIRFLRKLKRMLWSHVAGNHHHRVVWTIETAIEVYGILARKTFHLMSPANRRLAIGAIEVQRGVDLYAEPRARIVLDALIAFLEDDVAFGQYHIVREH